MVKSTYRLQLESLQLGLCENLVACILGDLNEEDLSYAVEYVVSNLTTHNYPSTNETIVLQELHSVAEKLEFHLQTDAATKLLSIVHRLLQSGAPATFATCGVLRLLLLLSNSPHQVAADEAPPEERALDGESFVGTQTTQESPHKDPSGFKLRMGEDISESSAESTDSEDFPLSDDGLKDATNPTLLYAERMGAQDVMLSSSSDPVKSDTEEEGHQSTTGWIQMLGADTVNHGDEWILRATKEKLPEFPPRGYKGVKTWITERSANFLNSCDETNYFALCSGLGNLRVPLRVVSETVLTQSLILVLRGYESPIIRWDSDGRGGKSFKTSNGMEPISLGGISLSLSHEVLERFKGLGNSLLDIRKHVTEELSAAINSGTGLANVKASPPSTYSAFNSSITGILEELDVKAEALHWRSNNCCSGLLQCVSFVEATSDVFRYLKDLTSVPSEQTSLPKRQLVAKLLNTLYITFERIWDSNPIDRDDRETSSGIMRCSRKLFVDTFGCYLGLLEIWVNTGNLGDPYDELFIVPERDPQSGDCLSFSIDREGVPIFLQDLSSDALAVGLKVKLLKRVAEDFPDGDKEHPLSAPECSFYEALSYRSSGYSGKAVQSPARQSRDSTHDVKSHRSPLNSARTFIAHYIRKPLLRHCQLINVALKDAFLKNLALTLKLRVLRALVLMGNPDLLSPLTNYIFGRLDAGDISWADSTILNHILSTSLTQSLANQVFRSLAMAERDCSRVSSIDDVKAIFERCSIQIDPSGHGSSTSDVNILSLIKFRFVVEDPLKAVIGDEAMEKYNKIAVLLLQVKRVKFGFEWLNLQFRRRLELSGSLELKDCRRLLSFAASILQFVNAFHCFILDQAVEEAWLQLERKIATASTVEAIQDVHNRYLEVIMERCFLISRSKMVLHYIKEMLTVSLDFKAECSLYFLAARGPSHEDEENIHLKNALDKGELFMKANKYLIIVLGALSKTASAQYLQDILLRLNFNLFFPQDNG